MTAAVDNACWELLAIPCEELLERDLSHSDEVIEDGEYHTVYRYGNTSIFYRIVETGSTLLGIKVDAVWDSAQDY